MSSARTPFDSLKPLAGRALEIALNRLLTLDPDTQADLAKLEGRRVSLALEAPAIALEISVEQGKLEVGPVRSEEADLGIRATLSGALSQLPFLRPANSAPVGKVRINGDAELARTLQQLANGFDPDWDKPFADAFGSILGPQIARVLREAFQTGTTLAKKFARDAADFVTEESRDVLGKAELAAFNDDVDHLRDDAERLIARVGKLRDRFGGDA
jgi:ubiquinone biosynthesis protein UbiJ